MSKRNSYLDRKVRIEVLRARAAIERGQMCEIVNDLGQSLEPASLLNGLKQHVTKGFSAGTGAGSWFDLIFSSGRRYPILFSGVSALVGTVLGKRKWRLGALGLTAWRLFGAYQQLQAQRQERYIQPKNRSSSKVIGPF